MALEICLTTDPVSKKWIPCPSGSTLDKQSVTAHTNIPAGTPYITRSDKAEGNDSDALRLFEMLKRVSPAERRKIARLNKDFGTEVIDALAEFYQLQLQPALQSVNSFTQNTAIPYMKQEIPGFSGAAATALESRLKGFSAFVGRYQLALEQYRAAYLNKASVAERRILAKNVSVAQAAVNQQFQGEIKRIMATNAAKSGNRGTVWSNPKRAMGLAWGSKTDAAIKLQSSHNFMRVQQFQRGTNTVGKSVIVLDAALRTSNIYGTYESGGDWQKALTREMAGFGLGVAAGAYFGGKATAALTLMLIATPYGWAIAIVGGLFIGLYSGKLFDQLGKNVSDYLWRKSSEMELN
jgi:hypothetical protein